MVRTGSTAPLFEDEDVQQHLLPLPPTKRGSSFFSSWFRTTTLSVPKSSKRQHLKEVSQDVKRSKRHHANLSFPHEIIQTKRDEKGGITCEDIAQTTADCGKKQKSCGNDDPSVVIGSCHDKDSNCQGGKLSQRPFTGGHGEKDTSNALATATTSLKTAEETSSRWGKQATTLEGKLEAFVVHIKEMSKKIALMEESTKLNTDEIMKLQDEFLEKEIHDVKEQLNEALGARAGSELSLLGNRQSRFSKLEETFELQSSNETTWSDLTPVQNELRETFLSRRDEAASLLESSLKTSLGEKSNKLQNLTASYEVIQTEVETYRAAEVASAQVKASLESKIQSLIEELSCRNEKISELEATTKKLELLLKSAEENTMVLKESVYSLEQSKQESESHVKTIQDDFRRLSEEHANTLTMVQMLECTNTLNTTRQSDLENRIKESMEKMNAIVVEKQKLEEDLQKRISKHSSSQQSNTCDEVGMDGNLHTKMKEQQINTLNIRQRVAARVASVHGLVRFSCNDEYLFERPRKFVITPHTSNFNQSNKN